MKKKMLCFLFAMLLVLPTNVLAAEKTEELWTREEGDGSYVTIRVPYPEGEGMLWSEYSELAVRYADTKEPIPLSGTYRDGYIFATVPAEDADRRLEVFKGESFDFKDCYVSWTSDGKEIGFYDHPLGTDDLYIRGIIKGDGTGNLKPDEIITRAEAFTIVCRLLSLKADGNPDFLDVKLEYAFELDS